MACSWNSGRSCTQGFIAVTIIAILHVGLYTMSAGLRHGGVVWEQSKL